MKLAFVAALATMLFFVAVPTSALAGWAGSRYEKSECHFIGVQGNPALACSSSFTTTEVRATDLLVADASCLSGFRAIHRVETVEVTWRVFDFYDGPVPLAKFNAGGDETPSQSVSSRRSTRISGAHRESHREDSMSG
jgi:hypothetical protein